MKIINTQTALLYLTQNKNKTIMKQTAVALLSKIKIKIKASVYITNKMYKLKNNCIKLDS